MTLAAQMLSDVETIFFNQADFGVAAKYSSHDGSIVSAAITVIFDQAADLGGTAYGAAEMGEVTLKLSDVQRPAIYDKITIDGTIYTVRMRTKGAAGVASVLVEADQRQKAGL